MDLPFCYNERMSNEMVVATKKFSDGRVHEGLMARSIAILDREIKTSAVHYTIIAVREIDADYSKNSYVIY